MSNYEISSWTKRISSIKIAALSLAADDANLSTREALIQAGYKPEEINWAKIQAASKQKN
jgi:hypothetical protein